MDRPHRGGDETGEALGPGRRKPRPPNWVDELIAMTRPGVEIKLPSRGLKDRVIPFQYDDFS